MSYKMDNLELKRLLELEEKIEATTSRLESCCSERLKGEKYLIMPYYQDNERYIQALKKYYDELIEQKKELLNEVKR